MYTQIIVLVLLSNYCLCEKQNLIIQTRLGLVKGHHQISYQGRKFAAFEGIPYAKPPIGEKRFEAPEEIEPWDGVWNASFLLNCAQTNETHPDLTLGDEDCLYINVYVPREIPNPSETLDVIVHIHGGAYMYGSGHTYSHPHIIMDRDVIFVTFNYRLGILGFLSTEDEVLPGNNGLKDQVIALKWIQKNIRSFGGNPSSVTLTGFSAGGASVQMHYFSEMSKGLFHRGFSQSGVALNSFSIQRGALSKAKILGTAVGCPVSNSEILVQCLKQKHWRQLLGKIHLFHGYWMFPLAPFAPVVEKGARAFLKEHPYSLLKQGKVLDVPWIVSTTAHEAFLSKKMFQEHVDNFKNNWKELAPILLDFNYAVQPTSWASVSEKIRHFYYGENDISLENHHTFGQMVTDRIFRVDLEKAVRLQSQVTNSPVYFYLFSYEGNDNKYVTHGTEHKYLYGPSMLSNNELKMREILLDMLVSYARKGVPKIGRVNWKPTKGENLTYLDLKSFNLEEIECKSVEEFSPIGFWNSLGVGENENTVFEKDEL